MKGLIYKDICVLLTMLKRLFIIILAMELLVLGIFALESTTDPGMYTLPVILYMSMNFAIPFVPCTQDEQSGWFRQGFTLPVSRLDCYHARILVNLLITVFTAVVGIVVAVFYALLFNNCTAKVFGYIFAAAGVMLLISMIISICANALTIRMEVQKAVSLLLGNILIINLPTIFGLLGLLIENQGKDTVTVFIRLCILLGVIMLGLTVTLYCLGRKWIQKKEV